MKTPKRIMTPEVFDGAKKLLQVIDSRKDICDILKISSSTLSRIKTTNNFQEYKRYIADSRARTMANKAESESMLEKANQIAGLTEDDKLQTSIENLTKTNEYNTSFELHRIANQLERLATAWEAEPKRKGIFGL